MEFAPAIFHFDALEKLDIFLRAQRRTLRSIGTKYLEQLAIAKQRLQAAHQAWNQLETQEDVAAADLIGASLSGKGIVEIVEMWVKFGAVARSGRAPATRYGLVTKMEKRVSAKCPSCGAVANAPKYKFLERQDCPRCRDGVLFVIRSPESERR